MHNVGTLGSSLNWIGLDQLIFTEFLHLSRSILCGPFFFNSCRRRADCVSVYCSEVTVLGCSSWSKAVKPTLRWCQWRYWVAAHLWLWVCQTAACWQWPAHDAVLYCQLCRTRGTHASSTISVWEGIAVMLSTFGSAKEWCCKSEHYLHWLIYSNLSSIRNKEPCVYSDLLIVITSKLYPAICS